MNSLAIASTALHLVYIIEWATTSCCKDIDLIIILKRPTDKEQITKMLQEFPWASVTWFDAKSRAANIFISIYELFFSYNNIFKKNYKYGVFADYGRTILANTKCDEIICVGDGTKILFEKSHLYTKRLNREKKQKLVSRLSKLFLHKDLYLRSNCSYFTPFSFEDHSPVNTVNDFLWLKQKYQSKKNINKNNRVVFFFGSYFSERSGKPLMKDDAYLEIMTKIAQFFFKRNLSIIYVPHRHESKEKLQRISEIANIQIRIFEYPAELQFFYDNNLPTHIASFFSTCLFHFNLLNLSDSITCFYIDFNEYNKSYAPVSETIYQSLQTIISKNNFFDVRTL